MANDSCNSCTETTGVHRLGRIRGGMQNEGRAKSQAGGGFKKISCVPEAIAVRPRSELGSVLGLTMVDQGRPKPALNTESTDKQR